MVWFAGVPVPSTVSDQLTGLAGAVSRCMAIYRAQGPGVDESTWSRVVPGDQAQHLDVPVVIVNGGERVECFCDDSFDPSGLVAGIEHLRLRGSEVVVCVPTAALGRAHRMLRGTSALLQGWWQVGDEIHFGHHEVP